MDKAKIAKLCNEIEGIACDISQQTMNDIVSAESKMIFDKAKEISAEISAPVRKTDYLYTEVYDGERVCYCGSCGAVNRIDAVYCKCCGAEFIEIVEV